MAPPAHSGYGGSGIAAAAAMPSASDVVPPPSAANRSDAGTVVTPPPGDDVPSTEIPPPGDDRPVEAEPRPTEVADERVASPPGRGIGPVARPPRDVVAAAAGAAEPILAPSDVKLASDFWPASSCVADPADAAPPPTASSSSASSATATEAAARHCSGNHHASFDAEASLVPALALAPRAEEKTASPAVHAAMFPAIRPAPEDVLFGTDAITRSHPGTGHLRVILDAVQEPYESLGWAKTKYHFLTGIIGYFHSQGGRFLKRDATRGGAWREVADAEARGLIMNRWRESSSKKKHPKQPPSVFFTDVAARTAPRVDLVVDPADKARIDAAIVAVKAGHRSGTDLPRGVTAKPSGKWQVQVYAAGKSRYMGTFESKERALRAYEVARRLLKEDRPEVDTEKSLALARRAAHMVVEDGVWKDTE